MQVINLPVVVVDTNGVIILTQAQAAAATSQGLNSVAINPSVDIVLVDPNGGNSAVPGSVPGTVANSPFVCPAGVVTMVTHQGGIIKGISTAGNSTVKVALGCNP